MYRFFLKSRAEWNNSRSDFEGAFRSALSFVSSIVQMMSAGFSLRISTVGNGAVEIGAMTAVRLGAYFSRRTSLYARMNGPTPFASSCTIGSSM